MASPGSSPATPSPPSSSPSPPAPSTSSSPPDSSPPPPVSSAPPPSPPVSQPPPAPPPSTPQTPPPQSSPPSPVTPPPSSSPPPPDQESPPPSPPQSPPQANSPPPSTSPPSPSRNSPPPSVNTPPSPRNPPPPAASSSPPTAQPTPPSPGVNQTPPPAKSPPSSDHTPPPPGSSSPTESSPSAPTPSGSTPSPPAPPTSTPAPSSNSSLTNSSGLPYSPPATPTSKAATPSTTNSLVPPTSDSSSGSSSGVQYGVAFGVVGVVLVVGFIAAFLFIRRQKKRKEMYNPYILPSPFASSQGSGSSFLRHQPVSSIQGPNSSGDFMPSSSEIGGLGSSKTWFSYEELSDATDGFATEHVLGVGGFGCVYKGYLADGREVAIKKLKAGSGQGDREFKAEVEIISRVHHRYLVSLVGYCINEYERLLVYEFVANNTLHYHLHAANKPVMEWALRVKVAAGAARGIAYLHEDCHPRIIHRDIKSANILLDDNFEAKVADFGLAKLAEELDANTHVSTRVMGTFGYMAPEYASSGKLTEKSDVYSFGVVLLEIITGRKPVDESQPLGDESLVEWARPLLTQALDNEYFDEVADPRLEGNYVHSEMFRMIEAAAACVRHSATKRPKMSRVVRALDTAAELSSDLSNGMRPGQSEIFNSREQSAQIRNFQRMAFGSQDSSSEFFNNSQRQSSWRSGRSGL